MTTPDRYTLLARKAVAEVNKDKSPFFAKLIMDGGYDDHPEMCLAIKAIELAIDELINFEDIQTMMATGKNGDEVLKSKDGGLTWTSMPYEQYEAEFLGKISTSTDAGTP